MKKAGVLLLLCFYINTFAQCVQPTIPTISASSTTLCSNQTATLSIASGTLNSATNWYWYSGSCGGSPVGTGTAVTVSPGQIYYVRGEGGCVTPGACANVTINAFPLLTLISTTTTQATCGNSNGTAAVSITNGSPPYSYNWNTMPVQTTSNAINLPPGNFTQTVTDNHGCTITVSLGIVAAVQPSVTVIANNVLCFGQANGSATVTATGVGGYTYNWVPSGLTTAIINNLNPAVHSVTVTDANGCKTFTSVNITQPNPIAINVASSQTICNGNYANLYALSSGGTPPYSYTMTNLANNTTSTMVTPMGMNAMPSLTSTTQYTASVTDAHGCAVGPLTMIVNVLPTLIANGYAITVCNGDSTILAPNFISVGNGGPYNYNWSTMTNSQNIHVIASLANSPATYTVIISDGCTVANTMATFTVTAAICTGIKANQNIDQTISFYPNPINDIFIIEQTSGTTVIKIISVSGQEVFRKEILDSKTDLDLSNLENGLYYLSFYKENKKIRTEKIIVQH